MMLFIVIRESIDTKELWNDIARYKVNETDMIDYTLVYGDVCVSDALNIVACCLKYSYNIEFTLKDSS